MGQKSLTRCLLGESDMTEFLIINIINSTPPSHYVMSIFCCPGTSHTHNEQIHAHVYRPIQRSVVGLCSLSSYLSPSLTSPHPDSLLFSCRFPLTSLYSSRFLSAFRSLSLSNHVHSNPQTFYNSALLLIPAWNLQ